ncbi:MAG: DNA-binding protein BpH2 [uncultured Phycisphaerae bacterium]|uniref:DNA-binding protein BpH2 n=1 Tax=uncultured Phycisphaerae bacterium TaxID=904963 RepID=A0A6J4Q741_9BACT|nr:MAG: DNA-binding protein BpH2 [uncultured Phycisphaerae bacterium]
MATSKAAAKAPNKSQVFTQIAERTGLTRKQVSAVFEELGTTIKENVGKKGPGQFVVPGLMKIIVNKKPATKAGTRPNPFKPGEMMDVKARPARNVVKVRPLKSLKEMVG